MNSEALEYIFLSTFFLLYPDSSKIFSFHSVVFWAPIYLEQILFKKCNTNSEVSSLLLTPPDFSCQVCHPRRISNKPQLILQKMEIHIIFLEWINQLSAQQFLCDSVKAATENVCANSTGFRLAQPQKQTAEPKPEKPTFLQNTAGLQPHHFPQVTYFNPPLKIY